jgi:membrane protein YqaA with SNARE-associated domain
MARQYAAILGMLAFFVQQARTLWHGSNFAGNVMTGIVVAAIFALMGAVIGGVADYILGDTLRQELQLRINAKNQK